jgi:hypothetical protein
LQRVVFSNQGLEVDGRVLATLVGVHDETDRQLAHDQGVA